MDKSGGKEQRHKQIFLFSRKSIALLLASVMLCSTLPSKVSALETTFSEYLCGFSETDGSLPESHICEIQSFSGYTPGQALSTYEAAAEETYDEICAALPKTLSGILACAPGEIEIPVGWVCGDYNGESGTYIFRPELKNENCSYSAEDDTFTESVDESELPYIDVVVPEAEAVVVPEVKNVPTFTSSPDNDVRTISDDTNRVSVTGIIPEGAYLLVDAVSVETAQELLSEADAAVLFAYDIKIMLPGDPEPTEFQPAPESPVTVTITPEAPMEAPVEVVHIAEIADGETEAQPVSVLSATESSIEFEAEGFSIYIGTTGSGAGIILTPGSTYKFYSDELCTIEIPSGQYLTALPNTIFLKANDNYTIDSVSIENEGGTDSAAIMTNYKGIWTLTFPDTLTLNQIITVTTYVNAKGGTISASSTVEQVAAMFDATATSADTDIISVSKSGSTFTVQVKNNIMVKGAFIVDSSANVILTTSENPAIVKRDSDSFTNIMFVVNGTLSLGTGIDTGSTVTYLFDDDSSKTCAPNDPIPTPPANANIIGATVNANYTSTTVGKLIIDGGAVYSIPVDADSKIKPVCTTDSTHSIIESSGTLYLWDGVTLQNNFSELTTSFDSTTDAGLRIIGGEFYMYGGIITQCSSMRSQSYSDGGGICFIDGDAYFYGGEITQCCADNGSAVAIFGLNSNSPTAYYLGTYIHHNLSNNHRIYPGQACSAYNGAAIRMYAGSIIDNCNTFDNSDPDSDYDMKPSGTNSGVDLFGGTIDKLGVVDNSSVNVYGCHIKNVSGAGAVIYISGHVVTISDCVALDTTDPVKITIKKENAGTYEDYITITKAGNGENRNIYGDLLAGKYLITVDSKSMQKVYTATVKDADVMATPLSRTMTTPALVTRTSNSIDLMPAGTGNAVDGEIFYGYSSTNDSSGVPDSGSGAWQTSHFFSTSGLTGNKYFFVKAVAPNPDPNGFRESISSGLEVNFTFTPSVVIYVFDHDSVPMGAGSSTTLSITTTPEKYDTQFINWSISGQNDPGTGVVKRNDGSGSVTIAAAETASTFTVTAELLDKDGQTIGSGVSDTVTVQVQTSAYISYSSNEAPTTLTAQLPLGSGSGYLYSWERADNGSEEFSVIPGETAKTYTATYDDIGKRIRVIITDGSTPYTASFVVIKAPQISITLPTNTVITANAAGDCSVSGGEFRNTSAVALYLTSVTYTWDTEAAEMLFTRWAEAKPIPKLTLAAGNEKSFTYTDSNSIAWNNISANNSIAIGASFTPAWTFSLNGNSLSLVPAVGESVQVATVTYTVGYMPSA